MNVYHCSDFRCINYVSIYLMFRYRTYRRPRYKVAYKMVTEMEWKCCHGYSGEDCCDGPKVNTQVNGGQLHVSQTNYNKGGGLTGGSGSGQGGKKTTWSSMHLLKRRPLVRTQMSDFLLYMFLCYTQVSPTGLNSWRQLSRAWRMSSTTYRPPCKELTRGCKWMRLMQPCSFTSQSVFTCTPEPCLHTGSWIRANLTSTLDTVVHITAYISALRSTVVYFGKIILFMNTYTST